MRLHNLSLLGLLCQSFGRVTANEESHSENIYRDVAIIGGGSAGTYTAIQLQKLGYSVALIETLGQLGGNVNTYVDPVTKETWDVGVVVLENIPVVTDYLDYLNTPYSNMQSGSATTRYANFDTGKTVKASDMAAGNLTAALKAYKAQLDKYPYLVNGYNLPSHIPSDFLLTWGEFIKKYQLEALAYTTFTYNQGVGNILNQTMLNIFKYLNDGELDQLLTGVALANPSNNNQEIYDSALAKLGSGAFLSSNVTSIKRFSRGGVQLAVTTPQGKRNIHAQQLVIAIRPTISALQPFLDLRPEEQAAFSQWNSSFYWCGLVANSGLPKNISVDNANPAEPYNIPRFPNLYSIGATSLSNGLHTVYYSSPYNQSSQAVQAEILSAVNRVREGLGYPAPSTKPSIAYFRSHQPFFLTVSDKAIQDGFYSKLEALQGKYDTHWTGAAWQSEASSVIWNYTQAVVLPNLVKSLAHK